MAKRRKMALGAENMPDDVYEILNEKSSSRQLTSYVVDLVQNEQRYEQLMQKLESVEKRLNLLNTVENKLDQLLSNGFVTIQKQTDFKGEEPDLKEGKIINATEVIGGIAKEDSEEADF
ncbi:TPA: hypothetical protein RMI67_005877 [Bacillus cereus]|uniref:Uncharacterized protein n=1 Tax=Bacillus toyonensis TaxID=155322 RepID=A0AAP8EYB9_9BACI|nr:MULTISPECIES: hypothetical protein [Bacillus]PET83723.1 hypothetical protein CN529_29535 [Bacillus thuringiensis]PEU90893.1 hypothetical protein CN409_27055 [Bacillus sp. AFS012607]PGN24295.1 hypothetical protein CN969_13255 [Bacillus thuringiensis]PGX37026.1 hypothetical protein COE13_19095 [Bacillus thuringiensis]PHE04852.1 hypothetical protein COF62_30775 [Bacillus toyonensis]